MDLIRYVQKKTKPYPLLYKILLLMYAPYGEIRFFIHALFTGKFQAKLRKSPFSEIVSKQKILEFSIGDHHFTTVDAFRQWLNGEGIRYIEGGWTIFIPPQKGLSRHFDFLSSYYPADSGLKILKDFHRPQKARYTVHRHHPAPGAALKRWLTPSPVALVRVANYLYIHGIGVRIYDILALKAGEYYLTCYVVQHIEGPEVEQKDYNAFMRSLKSLLEQGEITTIHESVDIMYDFEPPNCSNNLIMHGMGGRPLYVDFQGFLFLNENRLLMPLLKKSEEMCQHGRPSIKGKIFQTIFPMNVENGVMPIPWSLLQEMMREEGCSMEKRVVYEIGCNRGLMLYPALSEGALWGIGFYPQSVAERAKDLLLTLGATRFDLLGSALTPDTDFLSRIPKRYRKIKNGLLFYLGMSDVFGFQKGITALPWEYMFYEGPAEKNGGMSSEDIGNIIAWPKGIEMLSRRHYYDNDQSKRVVIFLKRQT